MNKTDRELVARSLRAINRRLKNIEGNIIVLAASVEALTTDVKNLLLVVQETQAQQRASRPLKLVPHESLIPTSRRPGNGHRRS